jgi:hypothetical protein
MAVIEWFMKNLHEHFEPFSEYRKDLFKDLPEKLNEKI